MKRSLILASLLVGPSTVADVPWIVPYVDVIDYNTSLYISLATDDGRRYLLEQSENLKDWDLALESPLVHNRDAFYRIWTTPNYDPLDSPVFFRVSELPWSFSILSSNHDSIEDLSVTTDGDVAFTVFTERQGNIYFAKSDSLGRFQPPTILPLEDSPNGGFPYYSSRYSEISVKYWDGQLFLVCSDMSHRKVILFFGNEKSVEWERVEISGIHSSNYFSFPNFVISKNGIFIVVYRSENGTILSYADHASSNDWNTIKISPAIPEKNSDLAISSEISGKVFIEIKGDGVYEFSTDEYSILKSDLEDIHFSDLNQEELMSIQKIKKPYEFTSNPIKIGDQKILILLSEGIGVYSALKE